MPKQSNNLLTLIAFLTFIGFGLSAGLMGVVWPSMRDGFGVGDDAYGGLTLAMMSCSLLVTAYSGALITRFGMGAVLLASSVIGGVGAWLSTLAPTWGAFVAIQCLSAVGVSLLNPAINTYFVIHESAGRMNWLHAFWGLGATISPALMTWVFQAGGTWRAGYGMLGAIHLGMAIVFGLTFSRWPKAVKEEKSGAATDRRNPRTLARPAVWLSLLMFFAFTGMESSGGQWSFTLFTEGRGIAVAVAGMWVSVYWASLTIGRVVFGLVVQKMPASLLVRLCMLGVVFGAAGIWVAPLPIVGFVGLALAGFCVAPLFPVLTSTTPERLGAARAANIVGYQITAVQLGLTFIPALGGLLSETLGVTSIGPFLFVVAAVAFLLHEATLRVKESV